MWISKKEIRELSEGIQKTLEGQEFDPRDDKEGPWSILKNDIYTLINLEREQRDIAVEEKGKLSEYLADISHQLKTPISSIQLMAELMTDAPENKKKEFLFSIKKEARHMEWLTAALLKMARLDSMSISFHKDKVEVSYLLDLCPWISRDYAGYQKPDSNTQAGYAACMRQKMDDGSPYQYFKKCLRMF